MFPLYCTDGTLDIVYQFYCASTRFNRLIEFHRLVHTHVPTRRPLTQRNTTHSNDAIAIFPHQTIHHTNNQQLTFSELRRIKTQPLTSTSMPALISPPRTDQGESLGHSKTTLQNPCTLYCCVPSNGTLPSIPTSTTSHQTHTLPPTLPQQANKKKSEVTAPLGPKCPLYQIPICWSLLESLLLLQLLPKYSLRRRDLVSH